jgi:uncharacterized protein
LFLWLDASTEKDFADIFELSSYPSVVILNPGKRKRFTLHEGEITSVAVE